MIIELHTRYRSKYSIKQVFDSINRKGELMKHWKCKQCIHGCTFRRQRDIYTPLPDGILCCRKDRSEIIEDDDEECKFYCCEAK